VVVDALGNPLALSLTGGQIHDVSQAETLTAQVQPEALLGDKGYDADSFIRCLEVRAIKPVIPPKSNRKIKRDCDFVLYAERNLIERFFNFIKHFRAIATRYEKTVTAKPSFQGEAVMRSAGFAARVWRMFQPCLRAVAMTDRRRAKVLAPLRVRKEPEIFILTFIIGRSRSA
jgi:transposase